MELIGKEVPAPTAGCPLDDPMLDHVVNGIAWDAIADAQEDAETAPRPTRDRFNWMQFRGQGPGEELFGPLDGRLVLELGCGAGDALAFLASRGSVGVGVDASERQIQRALSRWSGPLSGRVRFLHGDAADVLTSLPEGHFDVSYSVFGAIGYADPSRLLPVVHRVLGPRGRLLFAVRHPLWPYPSEEPLDSRDARSAAGRRVVGLQLTAAGPSTVVRYCFPVEKWWSLCREAGFDVDEVRELRVPRASLARWYCGRELEAMSHAAERFPCTPL